MRSKLAEEVVEFEVEIQDWLKKCALFLNFKLSSSLNCWLTGSDSVVFLWWKRLCAMTCSSSLSLLTSFVTGGHRAGRLMLSSYHLPRIGRHWLVERVIYCSHIAWQRNRAHFKPFYPVISSQLSKHWSFFFFTLISLFSLSCHLIASRLETETVRQSACLFESVSVRSHFTITSQSRSFSLYTLSDEGNHLHICGLAVSVNLIIAQLEQPVVFFLLLRTSLCALSTDINL